MLTRKNKMTKTFSIFHLFHGKVESIFNSCGTNLEIQYHNVVIPQFYHTLKYTTPTLAIHRDFKNKLQKVDGDFRPFRSSEMHEILCLVIIRVGFLKIENKNLVIEVVEELWRFDFISVQKFNLS